MKSIVEIFDIIFGRYALKKEIIEYKEANKILADKSKSLEKSLDYSRKEVLNLKNKLSELEEKMRQSLQEANEIVNLYAENNKELEAKLIEKSDCDYNFFNNYSAEELKEILKALKVPISDSRPHEKISPNVGDHMGRAPRGYSVLIGNLSKNNYVDKVSSEGMRNKKEDGIHTLNIVDNIIRFIYCMNDFGMIIQLRTTTSNKIANCAIMEFIKKTFKY